MSELTLKRCKRALVPIANPRTTLSMLEFAQSLIDPENGKILALFVTVEDEEDTLELLEQIRLIVEQAQAQDMPIELVERRAISPERGILDSVRELNVDLAILGFHAAGGKRIRLSQLLEDVAEVCPTDLLIYRSTSEKQMERILVPVRDSIHSVIALQQALILSLSSGIPLRLLHVQTGSLVASQAEIRRLMSRLPDDMESRIETVIVRGHDIAETIRQYTDDRTLVVLGFTESTHPDQWLFGEIPQQVLTQAGGAVVLVKRGASDITWTDALQKRLRRFAPVLTLDEQSAITQDAQEFARPSTNFIVLLMLATILASFGLLQSSAAVIIGAMLVAPLMSPLMGFGVGMSIGKLKLMWRAFLTVLLGVALALGTAFLIGLLAPVKVATAEMLARGQPTILDMGVACASGMAAAFALARKDIPGAIAGVAIAAALVPPICTTGLAIAFGDRNLAAGAGLLFTLNLISISIAAFVTFAWIGVRTKEGEDTNVRQRALIAAVVLIVLAVPLTIALGNANERLQRLLTSREVLEAQFDGWDIDEVEQRNQQDDDLLTITATLRGRQMPTQVLMMQAEAALRTALDERVSLEIVLLQVHSAGDGQR